MTRHRSTLIAGTILLALTAGPPVAQGMPAADDSGGASQPSIARQDLRSPDARDAAGRSEGSVQQDLRSPDTRDLAANRLPSDVVRAPVVIDGEDGFDVGAASVGAAAMLGLLLALAGVAVAFGPKVLRRSAAT